MASEQAKELRKQGIAAAKAGQKDQARQLLQQALRLEPGSEVAWLWLASVARDRRERLLCLDKLLDINPNNEMGLQSLQALGLTRAQLAQQVKLSSVKPEPPPAPPQPSAPTASYLPAADQPSKTKASPVVTPTASQEEAPPVSGAVSEIPLPNPKHLAELQPQVDQIIGEYLAPVEGYPGVKWVKKTRGRAGENDIWALRAWIAAGVVVGLIVVGIIGWSIITSSPTLRGIVFASTATPTRTPIPPTLTYTPTPGETPTPSPTPRLTPTPSPTVPPLLPNSAGYPPKATDVYPPVFERGVRDSISLLDRGEYDQALPTLVAEVTLSSNSFDPNPYYYEALALIGKGDLEGARQILQDAERRLPERPNDNFAPLINAGLAYVDLLTAQKAVAEGKRDQLNTLISNIADRALPAIESDPRLALPYLALAGGYRLQNDLDRALGVLERGLAVADLAANTQLIVAKGEIYFTQREYELADYQAFLALYIDPTVEPAHRLQIRSALVQGKPGLAVLRAQTYLYYYPGSVEAYQLLGQARALEGNNDLALQAYNQALVVGDNADILVARAAIYTQQGRYDQARDDLSKALALREDPQIRALRMLAAYKAGKLAIAQSDAEELLGQDVLPDAEIRLLQVRIAVDSAAPEDSAVFQDAITSLDSITNDLPNEMQPIADEYRARALYSLGTYEDALTAVDSALAAGETGSRHYLRGLILEASDQPEAALKEYDWVLSFGQVYGYPFLADVEERAAGLK